ncbi:MAG: ATP-grasp domain-containing protein, partial [Archaeoglobaceae archaeon]|nr:ATP-grasp domain-containing protein [Archaeoglobaceae archaeon]MDW8128566.1 ATP-grasp domain-containing protein [Archaeoglobaceae archaeon]
MSEKVLLIGTNVRNVASSAKRAGYEVYAITKYIDADLQLFCEKVYPIEKVEEAERIAQEKNAKVVLCSNFESFEINAELLCNEPKVVKKIVDKLEFYKTLEKAGIPHPKVLKKPEGKAIAKPRFGGGGEGIKFAEKEEEGCILQEFIEGIPCSVSLLSSREIVPLACNLVFSGWKEMNAHGFRYSGNLTPLKVEEEKRRELERIAIETAELFDLKGSIGIDFVLADKPYVLELNPRFQGSLDSVEWSLDVNLFSLHVKAFEEKKIERVKPKRFAIRAIYFADRNLSIKRDLLGNPFFA